MGYREDTVAAIFAKPARGIKMGLEAITQALAAIGNPQNAYQIVHVAGTNGKGSVCAMTASILKAAGFKTALYTSPHLVDFEERFIIDGMPISSEAWLAVYTDLAPVVQQFNLTFFEIATLIAFELFKREGVAWAVFETGLGGRLDATNVVDPVVAVITRIGIDHTEYLGTTIESIAAEKGGIIKPFRPLVIAPQESIEVEPLLREIAAERQSPVSLSAQMHRTVGVDDEGRAYATLSGKNITLPLHGAFQRNNLLTVLTVVDLLHISEETIAEGLSTVRVPGRFQRLHHQGREIIFDVGHNPQAAAICVAALNTLPKVSTVIVAGIMADKEYAAMMDSYASVADYLVCTAPATTRAASAVTLATVVPPSFRGVIKVRDSLSEGLEAALASACKRILICGSFYTVGEGMADFGIRPYGVP